ncbi:hypothetical protein IEO21_01724 [Rhodonia placenta]|uniref:Uncharacterized protein n=1 Tax=Rhodonia placenta TaxID=104341 RepID=A0A8H7P929_9APHY|nr:hypothetical protein IEO21_01724 [Postia placenta]
MAETASNMNIDPAIGPMIRAGRLADLVTVSGFGAAEGRSSTVAFEELTKDVDMVVGGGVYDIGVEDCEDEGGVPSWDAVAEGGIADEDGGGVGTSSRDDEAGEGVSLVVEQGTT